MYCSCLSCEGVKDSSWENLRQTEKWLGLPSHRATRDQREQSKGGVISLPLLVLRGNLKAGMPVWGMWGRPQGPGMPVRLPISVKADLARNELWSGCRARKEGSPVS